MKQYTKTIDGEVVIKKAKNIVVRTTKNGKKVQVFFPSEELILADGWKVYTPPTIVPSTTTHKKSRLQIVQELVVKQYNERTDISNNEALEYMAIIYDWSEYIGEELTEGKVVIYEDKPWRARQTHTVQEIYPPSLDTASLYEAIDKEHEGTLEDPIPYTPPMEIFEGKYYTQGDKVYLCTRNSEVALSHNLIDLTGLYVSLV